ncbi:MAG TPA: UDP-3-O-(3-hydroxymyristoyl)glucosamine N-acyltransferase [Devosia sp.]|nr:UDP-3-O-(3-hydroxymyristoyl)glucosamine N-acyltransferase [Devosia sp.]
MVDTRFHSFAGPMTLGALLSAAGLTAEFDGEGPIIGGAEELALAGPEHISLAGQPEYREALRATAAAAVIVSADLQADVPRGTIGIVAANPHLAFVELLDRLYPQSTRGTVMGLMGPHENLPFTENDVRLGPGVVLGPGVEIGRGTVVGPNTVIGAGVTIGRNCTIGSNCSIECAHLGNGVVLHAGARIGSEGFGWLDHGRSNRKIPQLGRVIIQDRVEIGANSTVDRGALGDTVIGEGTKIDNLVQIGHNCRIGRNCLLAGMSGLAGSTVLEDSVMLGACANTTGHLTIGRGSVLAARATATKSFPPGSRIAGFPAIEAGAWRREVATLRRLSKRSESGR